MTPPDNSPEKPTRRSRNRRSDNFPPVRNGEVPYAKSRPELKGMDEGELMRVIVGSDAWRDTVGAACAEVDRQRSPKSKSKALYTTEELEFTIVYQLLCGLRCYREGRDRLAGDRGGAVRVALGLDRPRVLPGKRVVSLRSGVPSEPTMTRHFKRFKPEERLAAYRALFERLVAEHFEFPEFREEARLLYLDGTHILTHYQPPILRKVTRTERSAHERACEQDDPRTLAQLCEIDQSRIADPNRKVTCPDGGYLPTNPTTGKEGGPGFNLIALPTVSALPIEFAIVPIHVSERAAALALLRERFIPNIYPHLDHMKLHVLTADSAFTNQGLRHLLRSLGIVENIHMISHGNADRSLQRAETARNQSIPIEGYPNWRANGLREISCACGKGEISHRAKPGRSGKAIAWIEGRCTNCGPITITSGHWQLIQNTKRFRRAHPDIPVDRCDWTFGNPLTYDSPQSAEYGRARWGHNEGFHGALERRFRLIKGKRWYRLRIEAEIDTSIIFSIMHALAMEQRRRAAVDEVDRKQDDLAA